MKGIELPINILIIIAVAVIVMLAIIAMYYPSFFSGSQIVGVESAKSSACQVLVTGKNCGVGTETVTINNFDADKDGTAGGIDAGTGYSTTQSQSLCNQAGQNDNLFMLCYCHYNIISTSGIPATRYTEIDIKCKKLCGC